MTTACCFCNLQFSAGLQRLLSGHSDVISPEMPQVICLMPHVAGSVATADGMVLLVVQYCDRFEATSPVVAY